MSNYIVDFEDTLTFEQVQAYCAEKNITIIKHLPTFKNVFIVSADVAPTTDGQLLIVVEDHANGIQLLNLDVNLYNEGATQSIDIHDEKNWWKAATLTPLDFNESTYENTVRGLGSTVYVMDSGIEDTHPEFTDSTIIKLYSFTGDFTDTAGHGTALASLISGKTCGLTAATIKVVKIFDENVPTKQSDLLAAFDAVAADFIASGKPVSVVNMSWGFARNDYINAKIQQLSDIGLLLVAAAGNSGTPIGDVTPTSIPTVLVVGAFDQTLKPCDFSNYTATDSITSLTLNSTNSGVLDCWAPGSQIWMAALGGGYGFGAGTSLSAAIASGALAYNLSRTTDQTGKSLEHFTSYSGILDRAQQKQNLNMTDISDENYAIINKNMAYFSIYGKGQLLDLSDPKYSNSYNVVIVYNTTGKRKEAALAQIIIPSNSSYSELVFDRFMISHVSAGEEWPSWANTNDRGVVVFNAPDITDPYLILPQVSVVKTYRDGTIGSTSLQLVVLRNDINKNNINNFIPENDPILGIVLYSPCNTGNHPNPCYGTCTPSYYNCYQGGSKGFYDCSCAY